MCNESKIVDIDFDAYRIVDALSKRITTSAMIDFKASHPTHIDGNVFKMDVIATMQQENGDMIDCKYKNNHNLITTEDDIILNIASGLQHELINYKEFMFGDLLIFHEMVGEIVGHVIKLSVYFSMIRVPGPGISIRYNIIFRRNNKALVNIHTNHPWNGENLNPGSTVCRLIQRYFNDNNIFDSNTVIVKECIPNGNEFLMAVLEWE